eukprot:gene16285-693_t
MYADVEVAAELPRLSNSIRYTETLQVGKWTKIPTVGADNTPIATVGVLSAPTGARRGIIGEIFLSSHKPGSKKEGKSAGSKKVGDMTPKEKYERSKEKYDADYDKMAKHLKLQSSVMITLVHRQKHLGQGNIIHNGSIVGTSCGDNGVVTYKCQWLAKAGTHDFPAKDDETYAIKSAVIDQKEYKFFTLENPPAKNSDDDEVVVTGEQQKQKTKSELLKGLGETAMDAAKPSNRVRWWGKSAESRFQDDADKYKFKENGIKLFTLKDLTSPASRAKAKCEQLDISKSFFFFLTHHGTIIRRAWLSRDRAEIDKDIGLRALWQPSHERGLMLFHSWDPFPRWEVLRRRLYVKRHFWLG